MTSKTYTPVGEWLLVQQIEEEPQGLILMDKKQEAHAKGLIVAVSDKCTLPLFVGDVVLHHTQGTICIDKENKLFIMHQDRVFCKIKEQ